MTRTGATKPKRLAGRIALITGASRGIGAAIAKAYAAEGARLILTGRTPGALEEVDDAVRAAGAEPATLVPFDLADLDKIDALAAEIAKRHGKLDILVGNAGILGSLTPIAQIEPKMWNEVLTVNLTACQRLIHAFDPLLRQSDAGRAIFVTSAVGQEVRAYWSAYAVSKAALDMMVRIYAAETVKTRIRANLVNPGGTRTAMRANAFPGEDPLTLRTPDDIAPVFVDLALPECTRHGEIVRAQ